METKTIQKAVINKNYSALLSAVLAKEDTRYVLSRVYYNADTAELCATNGRGLILIKLKKPLVLITGLYDLNKDQLITSDIEGVFPKYQDIMPVDKYIKEVDKIRSNYSVNFAMQLIAAMTNNGIGINYLFFEKLLKILNKSFSNAKIFVYNEKPEDRPVLIKDIYAGDEISIILMPFNTHKD